MPQKKKTVTTQDIVNTIIKNEYYSKRLVFNNDNDKFLWYNEDNNYIYLHKKEYCEFLFNFMEEFFPDHNVSTHLEKEVYHFLMIRTPRQIEKEDEEYISFEDKLFNLDTFEPEEKDKNIITSFNLPFKYDEVEKAEAPRFMEFLSEIFVNNAKETDYELINLVQEMCGSFFIPDMECSQAWFWVGEGGNGKSVFAKVIQSIFPDKICSSMNLQTMTTSRWSMAHLVGKRLNISAEEESKYVSSDKFKALVFGDLMHAEEKFGKTFEFTPKAKYVFLTNNMPALGSVDTGLKRRIQIIPFKRMFSRTEMDRKLIGKLKQELPGVVKWMLEGARNITEKDYLFSQAEATNKEIERFIMESNSSVEFVKELYDVEPNSRITTGDLYAHYKSWCYDNGRKPLSRNNFIRDVKREMELPVKTVRVGNSSTTGFGLILKANVYEEGDIDF